MKKLRNILVVLILAVIVTSGVIAFNNVDARSTSKYSMKTPKGMEHQRLSNMGDYYVYEDEDEYSNSYAMMIVATEIPDEDGFKDVSDDLYKKHKNMEDVEDYEEFLKELYEDYWKEMFVSSSNNVIKESDSKFVRIGKKNYKALYMNMAVNTDNEDVIVDDDWKAETYVILSDNNMYMIELIGNPSKIKKLRKYLDTFEIKDTFSIKGVVGMNRTLITVLICVGVMIIVAIVILIIVLIAKKKKNNNSNDINPIN